MAKSMGPRADFADEGLTSASGPKLTLWPRSTGVRYWPKTDIPRSHIEVLPSTDSRRPA